MSKCRSCSNAGNHPFCNLAPSSRAFFETNSLTTTFPRGACLFREGDLGRAIFVLASGSVKVSATSRDGRTVILRIATVGDILGLHAVLNQGEYEITAEALEPSRVRTLPHRHLTTMLRDFPDASLAIASALAEDYRAIFNELRLIALPTSPAGRVARLLLDWADDASAHAQPHIRMPLTHDEIASMTATRRETVTRTLGRFRSEKIISTQGAAMHVLRPDELQRLCAL